MMVELTDKEAFFIEQLINSVQNRALDTGARHDLYMADSKDKIELFKDFRKEWTDETAKELNMLQALKKKMSGGVRK